MSLDTTDPRANYPPQSRWVNQDPIGDKRIGGEFGKRLALIQRLHASKCDPPMRTVERLHDGGLHEVSTYPDGEKFHAYAWPKRGKWDTIRFGYRFDGNWGDANTRAHGGYNPEPDKIGGRFPDVIIKLRQSKPHIEV
jgi:hypothetical protein